MSLQFDLDIELGTTTVQCLRLCVEIHLFIPPSLYRMCRWPTCSTHCGWSLLSPSPWWLHPFTEGKALRGSQTAIRELLYWKLMSCQSLPPLLGPATPGSLSGSTTPPHMSYSTTTRAASTTMSTLSEETRPQWLWMDTGWGGSEEGGGGEGRKEGERGGRRRRESCKVRVVN